VALLGAGLAVGDALRTPGDDGAAANLAGWARDHGLNPVVTWLETQQYDQAPLAVGGLPAGGRNDRPTCRGWAATQDLGRRQVHGTVALHDRVTQR
jgi:hypothetical protein